MSRCQLGGLACTALAPRWAACWPLHVSRLQAFLTDILGHPAGCRVPEALIPPAGARVMSLQDGTSKMSKSAESDLSRINLLDPPDLMVQKVKVGRR